MKKLMLCAGSQISSLQFHEKIFCWKYALYWEKAKYDRIDLSGTPCRPKMFIESTQFMFYLVLGNKRTGKVLKEY